RDQFLGLAVERARLHGGAVPLHEQLEQLRVGLGHLAEAGQIFRQVVARHARSLRYLGIMKVIVIGAGPMGMEAALAARERGCDVTVLEKGQIGDSLIRWGPTRLFSPMSMNLSARARKIVGPVDDYLTGPEMAERVLAPLAGALSVKLGHRVI